MPSIASEVIVKKALVEIVSIRILKTLLAIGICPLCHLIVTHWGHVKSKNSVSGENIATGSKFPNCI